MHVHKISNSGHYYSINMLECIHVSLCTDDLTGFNYSLSVSPVLHVLVCVDVCVSVCVRAHVRVCVCVCVCERERETHTLNNNLTCIKFCHV